MRRSKVDSGRAQLAVDAVRSGAMSYRVASDKYNLSVTSIARRLKSEVAMDASVGTGIVLSAEEERCLEDALIWAAHRHCEFSRSELRHAVMKLCNDGRRVPWDREKGPGRTWLNLFFRRHPRLSERSCRIYEANRVTADDEHLLKEFYTKWEELVTRLQPQANHVWYTDETGALTEQQLHVDRLLLYVCSVIPGSLYSSLHQHNSPVIFLDCCKLDCSSVHATSQVQRMCVTCGTQAYCCISCSYSVSLLDSFM